ncbi:hypothetical protein ACH5RR_029081 [Cinchona calisaya]|uniref:Uncharacterized protein n=1 Tax=Cinchona calisaya TaxID=153742 RepID=A0ABD2YUJ3_9GENT
MASRITIGQLPLIIEGDETMEPFTSSRFSFGQDGEVPQKDVITNASDREIREEELDPKLGSENQDDNSPDGPGLNVQKRKHYRRHTQHQLKELEAFFKLCPHPDEIQRKQLSYDLGLDPLQLKFWFQNKRTQTKAYYQRANNARLKVENEKLRAENIKYKEALSKAFCPSCGGAQTVEDISPDEHQNSGEIAPLREEVEQQNNLVAKFVSKPHTNFTLYSPSATLNSLEVEPGAFGGQQNNEGEIFGEDELLRPLIGQTEFEKSMTIETAVSALEEVVKMSEVELPLWIQCIDDRKYVLKEDAYYHMFPNEIGKKQAGFKTEGSRDTGIVKMNYMNLVNAFMDTDKWMAIFASMVSRALVLENISAGVEPGHYNGTLQVIRAEFQALTPTVPTREYILIRYCKQLATDTWAVVDVSCDSLLSYIPLAKCRKRPSGCIIREMPNDCSKVTWIEHVEVDDQGTHYLGIPIIINGVAFGAQRWVAVLSYQCERLANVMFTNFPLNGINNTEITSPEARKNFLKLSERMVLNFYGGITSSTAHLWKKLYTNKNGEVRIMTKRNENDIGTPFGSLLNATNCFWLAIPQKTVFEFLRNESSRSEWDILCNGGGLQELVHVTNGEEPGNCVSLMRVNGINLSEGDMLILQECSSDSTASSIIYAPVDSVSIQKLMYGGNPSQVAILPLGFTILPSVAPASTHGSDIGGVGVVGSLVTCSFQIMIDSVSPTRLPLESASIVEDLIEATKRKLKAILVPNNA